MLEEEAQLRIQQQKLTENPNAQSSLAAFVEGRFQEAKDAKRKATDDMLDQQRRRKGTYSSAILSEINRQGGSTIWVKLTEVKCNEVEAALSDVVLPEEDRQWSLKPTPKQSLPPQLSQAIIDDTLEEFDTESQEAAEEDIVEFVDKLRDAARLKINEDAKARADRMSILIDDEFTEGGFEEALDDCLEDDVTLGTMIMKGPYISMERKLAWLEEQSWQPNVTTRPMMMFKCVDPLKFFPSPGATTTDDMTYAVEVDEFTRNTLLKFVGVPGWNETNIRAVIDQNAKGTTVQLDSNAEVRGLEDRQGVGMNDNPDEKFQGLWYTGLANGMLLEQWGLTGLDASKDYDILTLKLGSFIVHARLNVDPLDQSIYSKANYKPIKGSFWGSGVPRLMSASQDAVNASARHVINNAAIASGPQTVIHDMNNLAEGENVAAVYPWRIWQFSDAHRTGKSPITFEQPSMQVGQLLKLFDHFSGQADREIGVPQLPENTSIRTATGMSMFLNSASRVLKKSIQYIDRRVIRPKVQMAFNWNMLFVDDPSIKGDVQIVASGVMGLFVKEQQQLRLQEFMSLTANPYDIGIMGTKGRATVLRGAAKQLPLATEDVVPSKEEMNEREQAQAGVEVMPPGAPIPPAQNVAVA